jgi:hypothetical protein
MSELEIRRRQEYKRNRKKWIAIQIAALILVAAIALGAFLIYDSMNRTYYIEYTEKSNIGYKVQYKENEFFDEEWLGENQEYISSLINNIIADFNYTLNMGTTGVGFDYTYKIDATLLIADKDSGNPYYKMTENLLPLTDGTSKRSNSVNVDANLSIDYNRYNKIATDFIRLYALKNASSTLIVTLDVDVLSTSDKFEENNANSYSTSIKIPLALETFSIQVTSSAPDSESKVLAYRGAENQQIFYVVGICASVVDVILLLLFIAFVYLTRNEDITYASKVRRLVSAYSSYIQRVDGEFNDEGYQTVNIKTFNEMLGIRDTIQSPILMSENHDETMTRFLIPTNTNILYVFEIKVDNFDAIYAPREPEEEISETVEEIDETEEAIILVEDVDAEAVAEAMAQPDVILSEIEYEKDDDDEFEVAPDEPGVEVVGVVWPEKTRKNKVYRYDPNGEVLHEGDMVLVPTRDAARDREVIRKAAVAHGNHRVEPEHIKHPLKKIIGVIKRKAETILTSTII